jgi:hypothetical protein
MPQIPHKSTFSRAFAEFAETELPQRLHEALISQTQKDRLIGHIARDSTAIEARERYPENPPPKPMRKRYKRGPKPKRNSPLATQPHRRAARHGVSRDAGRLAAPLQPGREEEQPRPFFRFFTTTLFHLAPTAAAHSQFRSVNIPARLFSGNFASR